MNFPAKAYNIFGLKNKTQKKFPILSPLINFVDIIWRIFVRMTKLWIIFIAPVPLSSLSPLSCQFYDINFSTYVGRVKITTFTYIFDHYQIVNHNKNSSEIKFIDQIFYCFYILQKSPPPNNFLLSLHQRL